MRLELEKLAHYNYAKVGVLAVFVDIMENIVIK